MVASLIAGGLSLAGSLFGASAAKDAASTQAAGFDRAADLQFQQFQQTRADLAPWRQTGAVALTELADLYGLPVEGRIDGTLTQSTDGTFTPQAASPTPQARTGYRPGWRAGRPEPEFLIRRDLAGHNDREVLSVVPNPRFQAAPQPSPVAVAGQPDPTREERQEAAFDRFFTSPGYEFRLDEGIRMLDRSAAAGGRLNSGAQGRALERYGQGLASAEFGSYANRLAELAGFGQKATNTTAVIGADAAANAGNFVANAGTARASGFTGSANVINRGLEDLAYLALANQQQQWPSWAFTPTAGGIPVGYRSGANFRG